MTDPIRLSKRLIELTGCSRREAELYIEGGWVTVDGEVVEQAQFKVADGQVVALLPGATPDAHEPMTLLLNQPAGLDFDAAQRLLSPDSRWPDDRAQVRLLRSHFARLTTTLALQPDASGLLVLTQDWRTLRKLNEDASKLEQEYVVEVSGEMAPNGLERLKRGLGDLPPVKASWQNETHLRFALKNPRPGVIKAFCKAVGLHVKSMKRIRIGGVPIGKVPAGQWRYLGQAERF
ncbi:rRNA pseudouridine synthase [Metapseudomonas resinovorans]|uniref:Dual-specificity RNA pseudouridine synthase RluF n=1 Tax=Metapseudomonas resinovorans NBRC 106553 TaxID=1245471 RepID=S6AQP5_METRE|nr:rRNA pseudouridine synthase [Pseudomonas resinovorans]BAN48098.1 putative RNA-binding protein [Pseudomonas resinovorans NBRC 106553]